MGVVDVLQKKAGFIGMKGADPEAIRSTEEAIGTELAADYRAYVEAFGAAAYEGHELTGVCASAHLNVVEVSKLEREQNPGIPSDWYVLEQLNIDGVVIWQNPLGEVFQTVPGLAPEKIFDSLAEYVEESE